MNEKKKILARIAKCLALSQSPSPHEAAAALKKAQELMEEHQVSAQDVRLADVQERKTTAGRSVVTPPLWLSSIGHIVKEAFGVEFIYEPHWRKPAVFVFVGVDPAVVLAEYTFAVLRRKCTAARSAYYKKLRGKRANRIRKADDYAIGWCMAVEAVVQKFAKPVPSVVGEYLQTTYNNLTTCEPINRTGDKITKATIYGFVDGQGVELQQGVNGLNRKEIGAAS